MATRTRKKPPSSAHQPEPDQNAQERSAFPIVGVGASAGGIEAFTELLRGLPDSPGMGFVFILHQDPTHASNLAPILARATGMPVDVVKPGMRVEIDHVYVAPPNAEVAIDDGVLNLRERSSGSPSVIDGFLRSLAEDQQSRAISVVLSGSASDGTLGTGVVKEEGGITFAQDQSAKVDSMPRSAAASGHVDFVLSPESIAQKLVEIGTHAYLTGDGDHDPPLPEPDVRRLFSLVHAKHDLDLSHYKPSTIARRIRRRMAMHRAESLRDYVNIARNNSDEIEQLYGDILIRVTGFFRDAAVFEALQREVLPELLRERGDDETIRVWVPGCATGEEVYSLAIALHEMLDSRGVSCPIQIFGTDISENAIERARGGWYPESIAKEVGPDRLRAFFTAVEGGYRVNKSLRNCCVFARQNVTKDPPFSKLDLISCRNVMIYFGQTLQKKVISVFHYALHSGGYLLLGSSESLGSYAELFDVADRRNKIYRKKAVRTRLPIEFDRGQPPPPPQRHAVQEQEMTVPPGALFRDADRILLSRFTPPGVLINEAMDVLQFRGRTSRYLEPPQGAASFNLLKLVREGLLTDLRAVIHRALKSDAPQRREGVRVKFENDTLLVNVEAIPFVGASKERCLLVLFEEAGKEKKPRGKKEPRPEETPRAARLKRELESTREYLQSLVEEQEAMNEELRAANEEIQSSNEELQTTNEELETAKEELQSSNEELQTLNEELDIRNQDLTVVNNDLINLLTAIDIPVIMLDGKLRIRRFNAAAQRSWNLVVADIGRSINEIKTSLRMDNLDVIVEDVIEKQEAKELEIRDRAGRTHSLRVRPYRTADNKIDGAVLVLVDLEEFRRMVER